MFKVEQLFTKTYPYTCFAQYALSSSFEQLWIIRSQSLKVSKSFKNNQVTSVKKLLGVPNRFSL